MLICIKMVYIFVIGLLVLFLSCCLRVRNWFNRKVGAIFFNNLITKIDGIFLFIACKDCSMCVRCTMGDWTSTIRSYGVYWRFWFSS